MWRPGDWKEGAVAEMWGAVAGMWGAFAATQGAVAGMCRAFAAIVAGMWGAVAGTRVAVASLSGYRTGSDITPSSVPGALDQNSVLCTGGGGTQSQAQLK